jgi:hypothetical protein
MFLVVSTRLNQSNLSLEIVMKRTPHKHAELIHKYAEGYKIEVKNHITQDPKGYWNEVVTPLFSPSEEYRLAPVPKVKKWRWAVFSTEDKDYITSYCITLTEGHYDEEKICALFSPKRIVGRILETEIEVEE